MTIFEEKLDRLIVIKAKMQLLEESKQKDLRIIKDITKAIEEGSTNKAYWNSHTFFSPAGDDMGSDNTCIKFSGDKDIQGVISNLEELEELEKEYSKIIGEIKILKD